MSDTTAKAVAAQRLSDKVDIAVIRMNAAAQCAAAAGS
jgi:hypothetical protein